MPSGLTKLLVEHDEAIMLVVAHQVSPPPDHSAILKRAEELCGEIEAMLKLSMQVFHESAAARDMATAFLDQHCGVSRAFVLASQMPCKIDRSQAESDSYSPVEKAGFAD